jgi:hypothetical protein
MLTSIRPWWRAEQSLVEIRPAGCYFRFPVSPNHLGRGVNIEGSRDWACWAGARQGALVLYRGRINCYLYCATGPRTQPRETLQPAFAPFLIETTPETKRAQDEALRSAAVTMARITDPVGLHGSDITVMRTARPRAKRLVEGQGNFRNH